MSNDFPDEVKTMLSRLEKAKELKARTETLVEELRHATPKLEALSGKHPIAIPVAAAGLAAAVGVTAWRVSKRERPVTWTEKVQRDLEGRTSGNGVA